MATGRVEKGSENEGHRYAMVRSLHTHTSDPAVAHCRKAAGEQERVRERQQISLDIGTSLCDRKNSICLGILLGKDMIEGKRVEVCAIMSDVKVDRDECCL